MSQTFAIACTQCKKSLWIGQSDLAPKKGHLYSGKKNVIAELTDFLWDHENHPLIFCNDQFLDIDYEEIEIP